MVNRAASGCQVAERTGYVAGCFREPVLQLRATKSGRWDCQTPWRAITFLQEFAVIVASIHSIKWMGAMEKGDLTCPKCGAGFRRITLSSLDGERGKVRCPICDEVLELTDGSKAVAYRLTAAPRRIIE